MVSMHTEEEEEGPGEAPAAAPFLLPQVSTEAPAPAVPPPAPAAEAPAIQNIEILAAKKLLEEQMMAAGLKQADPMEKVKAIAARVAGPAAPSLGSGGSAGGGTVDHAAAMKKIQDFAATLIDPVSVDKFMRARD